MEGKNNRCGTIMLLCDNRIGDTGEINMVYSTSQCLEGTRYKVPVQCPSIILLQLKKDIKRFKVSIS